ncbi:MAG: Gfo/Idh/MocA family oxidoreductase [Clostridia bacterium]|nr:Gfo/Idh/MocA family oxidoreductase [Clostridia bacterium]
MRENQAFRPRILLVSVGMYGQKYLFEATDHDVGGDVVGIVDVADNLEKTFPVIQERRIPVYRSLESFFARDRADLAVISSPIHLHTAMVLECLKRGANVLCEKPLCLTEEETLKLADAAKEAQRFLALGWQLNYDRGVLALKKDILSGRFGKPLRLRCVHAMRRGRKYYERSNWAGRITLDGREVFDSPFMNACAHNFQLMTFLLGDTMETAADILKAEGELSRGNPDVENYDIAALRFTARGDVPLLYYTAHPLQTKNLGQMGRAEFEHATLTWGKGQPFLVHTEDDQEIDYGTDGNTPLMQKLYDAVKCTVEGTAPLCGPVAGLAHLRAVRMAQALPVRDIDPAHATYLEEAGDRFVCVSGLEEAFLAASEAWALPGEMGIAL